jgi:cob(I)alamin adenosyltransferase
MDWTNITSKKGDDGKSSLLFGRRVPKGDLIFELMNSLEMVDAQTAAVALNTNELVADLHCHHNEFKAALNNFSPQLVLDGINDVFIEIMGAVAGSDNLNMYDEKYSKFEKMDWLKLLDQLDKLIQRIGDELNKRQVAGGWLKHAELKIPVTASLAELTVRIRRAELLFNRWRDSLTPLPSDQVFKYELKVLNRYSKVTYMMTRYWHEISK